MKILVVGGTGIIGSAVASLMKEGHEVFTVGKTSGDYQADIESKESLYELFGNIGSVDAIISAAGDGILAGFAGDDDKPYDIVLTNKVMGQINLARVGLKNLNSGGSIILTSGRAATRPQPQTAAIAMGCAAIEAFVASAALEMENDQRINAVSPPIVQETMDKFGWEGDFGTPATTVAAAYRGLIEGDSNGQVAQP